MRRIYLIVLFGVGGIAARIEAGDTHDVLVVVGPPGATRVPFET